MPNICMACIYVKDLDEAIAWYRDVLGFCVSQEHYHYPVAVDLEQDGLRLLLHRAERSTDVEFGMDSCITLGLRTPDIRDSIAQLKTRGAALIHEEPQQFPAGEWFAVRDPFGNVLELIQFAED
jgi:lactoylglutathione lyase